MGYTAVLVLVTSPLTNVLHICINSRCSSARLENLTDLMTGALAIDAGWKLNAPFASSAERWPLPP